MYNIIITIAWVIAAGINAVAPGNFVRHSAIDESGIHPLRALYDTINVTSSRWNILFKSTNIVFLIILVLLMGFMFGAKLENNSTTDAKIIVSALGLFAPIVTSFPISLGYSSEALPDRCAFLMDVAIILSSINFSYLIGKKLRCHIESEQEKCLRITIIMIATIVFMLDGYGISNVKIFQISRNLSEEVYESHYYYCKEFIESLKGYNEGEDVRISSIDFPPTIDDIYNFYLSDDPSYWVNVAVAKYYGFNSIAIFYEY